MVSGMLDCPLRATSEIQNTVDFADLSAGGARGVAYIHVVKALHDLGVRLDAEQVHQ